MSKRILFTFFGLLFFTVPLRADVVVLIHGYLGNAYSWEVSGVNAVLESQGWARGGVLSAGPAGTHLMAGPGSNAANKSYSVELPSMAPVMIQSNVLRSILDSLALRHPGESMHIVGHSAGGVVARTALVQGVNAQVKSLITIAAPHLGTERAIEAIDTTSSSGPFGIIKDFFGGGLYHTVKDSRGLLVDLVPAHPGSMLFWLNSQVHPDLRYVSILRSGPVGLGDELVPVFSQDMNRVPALAGKSETTITPASHSLNPEDGRLIAQLLAK